MSERSTRRGAMLLALLAAAAFACEPPKDAPMSQPATKPEYTNHLIHATSPYLLQHAHNPVDWYEWGPEALEKARRENKPIFLSIGYSACHWCHVMAHESFEDPEIAAIMNKYFINIKVDREERPDLDEIYMRATVILTRGHGGWPMSVWLTPDLKPFFAGTYFPPRARFGRPGFKELCERIGELWQTRREDIEKDAQRLTQIVQQSLEAQPTGGDTIDLTTIDQAVQRLTQRFDEKRGGMLSGRTNKFPPSMSLELMLRAVKRWGPDDPRSGRVLRLITLTLDQMAAGGIYDQLGGGFHRYSTDPDWHIPHFEKMLYDQALVSRIYLDAYQFTHKPLYARIARETFDYVIRDMQSPEGGFYSTRDADSEGEEGKYYVWTYQEVLDVLGEQDGKLFCAYFDVRPEGNWNDPHAPGIPKNVLHVVRSVEDVACAFKLEPEQALRRLLEARRKLLKVRSQRVPPALDDKILAEWNGMMISSLSRGGRILDEPKYIDAARKAADFILTHQYADGRLYRSYRNGKRLETAFLTDYACMIEGLLDLYEATFEPRWLEAARKLNATTLELFWDDAGGGFFFTPDDHEPLLARSKDVRDGATPSGNSVQLMNMLRLTAIFADEPLGKQADQVIRAFSAEVRQQPLASERFLCACEFARLGPVEIAIVGPLSDDATQALVKQVWQTYLPNRVLMHRDAQRPPAFKTPLLEGRTLVDGKPAAYVCRDYACKLPVTTAEALAKQLTETK